MQKYLAIAILCIIGLSLYTSSLMKKVGALEEKEQNYAAINGFCNTVANMVLDPYQKGQLSVINNIVDQLQNNDPPELRLKVGTTTDTEGNEVDQILRLRPIQ